MSNRKNTSSDIRRLDLNNWKAGEVSSFYASRVVDNGLKTAENIVIKQNGTASPRGSFEQDVIADLPYPLLGNIKVYRDTDGSENLICMLDNGTNGVIYTLNKSTMLWVAHDQYTFSRTASTCFTQSTKNVVAFNGIDNFSYFDTSSSTVKRFNKVDNPTAAPTLAQTGLAGTNFTIYYAYNYVGNGGETALSPAGSVNVSTLRDTWSTSQYIAVTRPAATDPDAVSWNLWYVMVSNGAATPTYDDYELISETVPLTTTVITDNGKLSASTVRKAPESNNTEGIIAWYGTIINGRIWAINDHTVHHGGDIEHELTFGGAYGSGFDYIDKDGKEMPMAVQLGRDNAGTTCINVLAKSLAGQGGIYDVYFNTITVSNTQIQGWEFKRREGNDGTDAPFSVLHADNNLSYLSLEGFKSTGVRPNIVGIQSTDIISNAISDKFRLISSSSLSKCYSTYFDEKIFWSVAYSSPINNQLWVYDIRHGGIWTRWAVPSDALFRWSKNSTTSVGLYIVKDKKVLRYSPNSIANVDGSSVVSSTIDSGIIKVEDDGREWFYLLNLLFIFLAPTGSITISVTGKSMRGDVTKTKKVTFSNTALPLGWNAITKSTSGFNGTHNLKLHNAIYGTGVTPREEWVEVSMKFNKLIQYFTYSITVNDKDSAYELSQVVPEYVDVGIGVDMLTRRGTIKI